ncbi:hypothetical protein F8S13_20735 [Chloroflexia bacterium SDU3-3]|nr:hypothetical protein F8S13_20735 [Chloroflexia bacterium SDU3-3]
MMRRFQGHPARAYRIPIRLVEAAYGAGNFDDAGDEIAAALADLADYPGQVVCRFAFDCAHHNPWYHALVVGVAGLPEALHASFAARLAALGLPPEGRQVSYMPWGR